MAKSLKDQLLSIKKDISRSTQNNTLPKKNTPNKPHVPKNRIVAKPVKLNTPLNTSPTVGQKVITEVVQKSFALPITNVGTQQPWIKIGQRAKVLFESNNTSNFKTLNYSELDSGRRAQFSDAQNQDAFEFVIGLDFGTSSTKVIVGDPANEKAYAVPFMETVGINQYLLPSRLYETAGNFSIRSGQVILQDLKLALIANLSDENKQIEVIAFVALVIRHARAWFYATQTEIYGLSKLLWKLVVGLPVAHQFSGEIPSKFKEIGEIAWSVANDNGTISRTKISRQLAQHQLAQTNSIDLTEDDAEVQVIPEISAQIYGFVKSTSFNPRVSNVFMMVDVGAGTVDSSLFQVRQSKVSGKFDFEFFTSVVEAYGVMNLHRSRIQWWKEALKSTKSANHQSIEQALDEAMFPTDRGFGIPNSYTEYITDTEINASAPPPLPDADFYKKLTVQVQSHTFYRAWEGYKDGGFLSQQLLKDTPIFFCGGGMRLQYYKDLEVTLKSFPLLTWLTAIPRAIQKPERLDAAGVSKNDFDRLSVAFGLSFVDVGEIIKAIPVPRVVSQPQSSYRDYYVDKDAI